MLPPPKHRARDSQMPTQPNRPVIISAFPKTAQAERDRREFLQLLGGCITLWAHVDRALYYLTHRALGLDHNRTAVVFYNSNTLAGHLANVTRLLRTTLPRARFTADWKPLEKEIDLHLKTRSIYAHHPMKRTGTSRNGRQFHFYSIHIEPAERPLNKQYDGLGGKTELLAQDLRKHAHSLEKLVTDISKFTATVPKP